MKKLGETVGIISIEDERYPKSLKEIGSLAPKKLFYKGTWDETLFKECLAVVGSRKLTMYGRKVTEQIVSEAVGAGITIVSGFMYGGDEAAHSAAVKSGGRTVAVMPCGIDLIHPAQQAQLYQDILDNRGLILSEYEGDLKPQTWMYVQRDRLVAALSKATFVTEAAVKSGSLLTAGYAQQFGRKVFALPGPITSEVSRGTIQLIREGAEAVSEANDILRFFKVLVAQKKPHFTEASRGKDTLEEKILDQLGRESLKADEMARVLGVSVAHVGTALSLLQLRGIINQDSGKYYIS